MGAARPSTPRIAPVEKVIARAREVARPDALVRPIHLAATLAHNRPVRDAIETMSGTFFDPDMLDPRLRELIILRMGWDTQAAYEFGQHVLAGRKVGLTEEEIRLTTRPVDEGTWTPLEAAALRMADDLHRDDCVSDAVWAEVSGLVDERMVIAMVGLAGFYRMVACVLNSLGIQPEDDLPRWPAG